MVLKRGSRFGNSLHCCVIFSQENLVAQNTEQQGSTFDPWLASPTPQALVIRSEREGNLSYLQ